MNSISSDILKFHIKYSRLTQIMNKEFGSELSSINNATLFIDLYSIYKSLLNRKSNSVNSYDVMEKDLLADTLNLICHYKKFFNYKNINIKIFLVFSYNISENNRQFVDEYNSTTEMRFKNNPFINENVEKIVNRLYKLQKFFKDIYVIYKNLDTSVLINSIMNEYGDNSKVTHFILTKDAFLNQLLNRDNAFIIRPYREKIKTDVDSSYLINQTTSINDLLNRYKLNSMPKKTINLRNVGENFAILISLIGSTQRGVIRLCKTQDAINILNDLKRNDKYEVSIYDIKLNNKEEQLMLHYKALSINYQTNMSAFKLQKHNKLLNDNLIENLKIILGTRKVDFDILIT